MTAPHTLDSVAVVAVNLKMARQVEGMFDESQGTLRLSRDVLGDERVPSLSLQRLRGAYRDGTGSLRSWTTVGAFETGED